MDVSSSGTGTDLLLSVPIRGASAQSGETEFDQDDDHDPTAWGQP